MKNFWIFWLRPGVRKKPAFEKVLSPEHHVHLKTVRSDGNPDGEKITLSQETVQDWAKALGLPSSKEDLAGLTSRVHHMFRSLAKLDQLSLEDEEPGTYFIVPRPGE